MLLGRNYYQRVIYLCSNSQNRITYQNKKNILEECYHLAVLKDWPACNSCLLSTMVLVPLLMDANMGLSCPSWSLTQTSALVLWNHDEISFISLSQICLVPASSFLKQFKFRQVHARLFLYFLTKHITQICILISERFLTTKTIFVILCSWQRTWV